MKTLVTKIFLTIFCFLFCCGFLYTKKEPDYSITETWKFSKPELAEVLIEYLKKKKQIVPHVKLEDVTITFEECADFDCASTINLSVKWQSKKDVKSMDGKVRIERLKPHRNN